MTLPSSLSAYEDCIAYFDRALSSSAGIRIPFLDRGDAVHLQSRLNYCRVLTRRASRDIFAPDSPEYGRSPYEGLVVRSPREADEEWWIYIEPIKAITGVEELKAAE